jgi:hypothetical protein
MAGVVPADGWRIGGVKADGHAGCDGFVGDYGRVPLICV